MRAITMSSVASSWSSRVWKMSFEVMQASPESERLAAGEAGVEFVPPRDRLFAEPPTEVDDAAVALAGEVDEALVDALQLHADAIKLLNHLLQLHRRLLDLLTRGGDVSREVTVAACKPHQALELSREGVHVSLGRLNLGHQLTHGGQEDNRLVQGKQPQCHVYLFVPQAN